MLAAADARAEAAEAAEAEKAEARRIAELEAQVQTLLCTVNAVAGRVKAMEEEPERIPVTTVSQLTRIEGMLMQQLLLRGKL